MCVGELHCFIIYHLPQQRAQTTMHRLLFDCSNCQLHLRKLGGFHRLLVFWCGHLIRTGSHLLAMSKHLWHNHFQIKERARSRGGCLDSDYFNVLV